MKSDISDSYQLEKYANKYFEKIKKNYKTN